MKKILISNLPILLASTTLLIVTCFLRYNLYLNGQQLSQEFLTQNAQEIYSVDTLKITSRLNSLSRALNWVCIEASVNQTSFFKLQQGLCETTLFKQKVELYIPEANKIKISFTIKLPHNLEYLFITFFLLQLGLILSLILATQKSEQEKRQHEMRWLQLSRKMFHDIRSPLASINTLTSEIQFQNNLQQSIFRNSILRINDIANSLLDQTQSQVIKLPEMVDLYPLISEIIEQKNLEYQQQNLNLFFDIPNTVKIYCVPNELQRIFSNLINNSIEAHGNKIEITLGHQNGNDQLSILIKDNGRGIPPEFANQLGKIELSSKKHGNGIGFKEAKESLIEWGGDLKILSSTNLGTQLELSLKSEITNHEYILIDDDELVRLTWEIKARKQGLSLKAFSSASTFLDELNSIEKKSFIYIDAELGTEKGDELAEKLHRLGYTNLSMTSGHPASHFKHLSFLKTIISKTPPF